MVDPGPCHLSSAKETWAYAGKLAKAAAGNPIGTSSEQPLSGRLSPSRSSDVPDPLTPLAFACMKPYWPAPNDSRTSGRCPVCSSRVAACMCVCVCVCVCVGVCGYVWAVLFASQHIHTHTKGILRILSWLNMTWPVTESGSVNEHAYAMWS